ncbi:erythromycin esterase family protein [Sinomicrobium weinanense]|uniref:Erythromycin esterase family protein n=1 Tax=Sinomicrobium weinanense TaxID=2842200 RepID=A0A926JWP0_9FLAO|nr:erythromycin esterase family protein [Sinomicrobium weinanense]MBC9798567.1 erythromycin esterase family protein [Sinomicrobium weinanense]MBU3126019.1 erythromycin esterase family protein [Sinomicrobium weinanense]
MKYFTITILLLITSKINSQNKETVQWINQHLIEIEDANPDSTLENFIANIPDKFQNAKIFGFGEATHHGKEFFTIKTKFFKYLVLKMNVKAFLMEESYPAESGINEWITGGKGNPETIATNFSIVPWRTKEVVNLLKWMRSYNLNKSKNEQIQFYGIDIQYVGGINKKIRDFVKKHKIKINENLLSAVDRCVDKKVDYNASTDWADRNIPELEKVKKIIWGSQSDSSSETKDILRALDYLMGYTFYVQNHKSQIRDLKMFENAKYIIDNLTTNGKAFIWAHNEHINNLEMLSYGSGWTNLGARLKKQYKDKYYSVGFDFGIGNLRGYVAEKNKPNHWEVYSLRQPYKKTYSATLFEADNDIYFISLNQAKDDSIDFFDKKEKQLILGAPGYNPKNYHLIKKRFSEMYDGLIFIKKISVPDYNLDRV